MYDSDAPSFTHLRSASHMARKPYTCCRCRQEIEAGNRYDVNVYLSDGDFIHERMHVGAYLYPSGCPSIREKDIADMRGAGEGAP
ncbi:hypothetical protein BA190_09205 [Labrys sp. WJW]|uniref:hypothetical protein n=1 Tax=Labrys sp. WJW TaxID=1737983 RepID=UPI00082E9F27|nr:hypothetical protein [Labrys sp. WJW]OCC05082.1 hypothetical protein BA190_09205 [Labrys sp. WJW]